MYDTTWQGNNTLTFSFQGNSNLKYMINETTGYVKTITTRPLEAEKGFIEVKLECSFSSNSIR